jgi:oxygen-independent coproporphyrinogen-3 oxidase
LSANYELCPELSGLYIHIPFCRKACTYCNFHFTTGQRYKNDFIQYLKREYDARLQEWPAAWETVYFGGGTPSLLPASDLGNMMEHIKQTVGIETDAEITLEANPEDVNMAKIEEWKEIGINRISLGVQSLSDAELKAMNRSHLSANSLLAMGMLVQSDFRSVNLDLIYGSPWLSDAAWSDTLDWAFSCGAQHISAYALTAEPATRLFKDIHVGKTPELDDDKQARHFELLQEFARKHQWEHYETSNLCKPGFEARHNSNYWNNKPYVGIGPSAHSFDGKRTRRWNVSDNLLYVNGIENGQMNFEHEELTDHEFINELIITRLRKNTGLNVLEIHEINAHWETIKRPIILEMSQKNLILFSDNHIVLTERGRLFSDAISRDLMI